MPEDSKDVSQITQSEEVETPSIPDDNEETETNALTTEAKDGSDSTPHVYVEQIEYLNLVDSEGDSLHLIPISTDGRVVNLEVQPVQADTALSDTLLVSVPVITVGIVLIVVVGFACFGSLLSRHLFDRFTSR